MTIPCLVRVLSRSSRQLLRSQGRSPAEIKADLAQRLGIDPDLVVIIHGGDVLLDDRDLMDLKRPSSQELGLVAFVLDPEQCRLAESVKEFEPILTTPSPSPSPAPERNVVFEIPVHNALEFLGSYVTASLREPLTDMGFPEARVIKALLLNGLSVERAMEWLLDHSNDEDIDAPLNPYQVSQLISSLISSQSNVLLSGRSATAVMRAVDAAIARRQCTFSVTRNRYVHQKFRCCNTCSFVNGRGVCLSCAAVCHAGHDLSDEISGEGFFCDCGSGSGTITCQCMPQSQQTPRIFSNRIPFTVTDLAIHSEPSACQPFAVRLGSREMIVLIDLLRKITTSSSASISENDIGTVALLLDVIDQIPVHVIALFAMIVRQKQGVERILESPSLSNSLIPRITSVCIESNVQIQILRTCLAFSINLTANVVEQKQWYSFALSSFSHMISVCSSLVCHGSGIESLFAIELLGNYALMSPHIPENQRRTLLSELLNGAASRTENAALLLKILIALGTVMELVPSIITIARQMTDLGQLFDQLSVRWPSVIPAITRFREMVDRS